MDNNNGNCYPVIFIADSLEQAKSYRWGTYVNIINKNIMVLTEQQVRDLGIGKPECFIPQRISPGDILIKNLYGQGYIQATSAEENYLKEQVQALDLVSKWLGAKTIRHSIKSCTINKRTTQVIGECKFKVVEVDANYKRELQDQYLLEIGEFVEFDNSQLDFGIDSYNNAKNKARERGFLSDKEIIKLFDLRDPQDGSALKKQNVRFEIFSSLNDITDIAFSLKVADIFNLNTNVTKAIEYERKLIVEWEIEF